MNARLVYVTDQKGRKSVRAEYELTQCGGVSTGHWWTIGTYKTAKGAKIAISARARYHETYINWCCPSYVRI